MNSKFLLNVLLLIRVAVGQFAGVQNLKQGKEANACAAIVAQCIRRCTQRLDEGITRTEYIQMTIVLLTNDVNCTTEESEEDEMVSTDPPNNSRGVVVFNVPCCQQRQQCVEGRSGTGTGVSTIKTNPPDKELPPILPTVVSTTDRSDPQISASEKDAITMIMVVFTILNFAVVFIILTLMLWKVMKKRNKKTLEPGKQSSPTTLSSPTSNGAILMGVIKERSVEDQERHETEETHSTPASQDSNTFRDDYPPLAGGTTISQNYVVLDTASKSARSRSQGTVEQSPEVLIVGGGRYGSKEKKNSLLSNGPVMKFNHAGQEHQEMSLTAHHSDIDQVHKFKRSDISKQRSGSSPGTFEITESAYDRLNQMDTDELSTDNVKDLITTGRPRACSSKNRQVGTTSLDRLQLQSIYNVLRGNEEIGTGGDYQRLSRTHKRDESHASSLQEFEKSKDFLSDEDNYVKEFELLSQRKFSESQTVTATTEEKPATNSLYAETIPGSISMKTSQVKENGLAEESADL